MNGRSELTDSMSYKIRNAGIICAFLVVLIHCRPHFEPSTVGWWVKEVLENGITHIAVPFFFAVTGYMMARDLAAKGYRGLVVKRTLTLGLPFFLWNILFWMVCVLGSNVKVLLHGGKYSIPLMSAQQFGLWYTGCPLLSPLWYVRAIFVLALISPLILWSIRKIGVPFLVVLFVIYGILCPFWPVSEGGVLQEFFRVGIFPVLGIFYVALGMALHEGVVSRKTFPIKPLLSLTIGVGLVVVRAVVVHSRHGGAEYLGFASVPFVLSGFFGLVSDRAWPRWLVTNAFGVYLIHKFVLLFAKPVLDSHANVVTYLCVAIMAFSISLGATILLKRLAPAFSKVLFGGR